MLNINGFKNNLNKFHSSMNVSDNSDFSIFKYSSEFRDFLNDNLTDFSDSEGISIFDILNQNSENENSLFFMELFSELLNDEDLVEIIDTNQNGKIEKEELEEFFNSLDENKNSEITFGEFFNGLDSLKKKNNKPNRTQPTSSTPSPSAQKSDNNSNQSSQNVNDTEKSDTADVDTDNSTENTQNDATEAKDDTNAQGTEQNRNTQTQNTNIKTEFLTDEKTGMSYLLMSPENPDPNTEYPVMVFMSGEAQHGAGEKGLYADTTPVGAMKDWNLENFNGYVIIPYQKAGLKNWYNDYAANVVKSILDNLNDNQKTGKTVIVGASSGAPGAGYIANKLGTEYFDETVCIAEVIYGKKTPDMPVSYYVGTEDGKIRDMRNKIGEDLNIVEGATHGSVVKDLFNTDLNNDGKSDFLQDLFGEED
ncbi:hypothetical protein IKQ26_08740 [bacterium]|nr:hypothetical protein [bacterium]